jgi:hypothetical protein
VNPRRAPERIGPGHRSDQRANLRRDPRAAQRTPRLPGPEEPKPLPMPGHTVAGFTRTLAMRQPDQMRESQCPDRTVVIASPHSKPFVIARARGPRVPTAHGGRSSGDSPPRRRGEYFATNGGAPNRGRGTSHPPGCLSVDPSRRTAGSWHTVMPSRTHLKSDCR